MKKKILSILFVLLIVIGINVKADSVRIGNVTIPANTITPTRGAAVELVLDTEKYTVAYQNWRDASSHTVTTFAVEGGKYSFTLVLEPKEGYYFDESDKIIFEDIVWLHGVSSLISDNQLEFRGTTKLYEETILNFADDQKFVFDNVNDIEFIVNGDYNEFLGIDIDYIDKENVWFTVSDASVGDNARTKIKIDPDRATGLVNNQEYVIEIKFNDSIATANFIKTSDGEGQTPTTGGEEQTPATGGEEQTPPATGGEEQTPPATGGEEQTPSTGGTGQTPAVEDTEPEHHNPQTGDDMITYIILGSLSIIGLVSCIVVTKKRFY